MQHVEIILPHDEERTSEAHQRAYAVRHSLRLAPLLVVDVIEVVAVFYARNLRLRRHCQGKEKEEDGERFIHDEL